MHHYLDGNVQNSNIRVTRVIFLKIMSETNNNTLLCIPYVLCYMDLMLIQ